MSSEVLGVALYKRTLNNIYELLERIHLKGDGGILSTTDEEGVKKFYQTLILINKRSKRKKNIPFICHKTGNA
jgi:hypothetical protein